MRYLARLLRWVPCVAVFVACGPTQYAVNMGGATAAVERAKEARARTHAAYEYYYAEAHLDKAREEAAEASYEDAVRYAGRAETFGNKAADLAQRRMREMGR